MFKRTHRAVVVVALALSLSGCCLQGLCYAGGLCDVPTSSAALAARGGDADVELARAPMPPRADGSLAY